MAYYLKGSLCPYVYIIIHVVHELYEIKYTCGMIPHIRSVLLRKYILDCMWNLNILIWLFPFLNTKQPFLQHVVVRRTIQFPVARLLSSINDDKICDNWHISLVAIEKLEYRQSYEFTFHNPKSMDIITK